MAPRTLYILYNADASLLGKLTYSYRKLTAPKDQPACAACDITHGGLHLDETAEWRDAKVEIAREAEDVALRQLHRDQMGGEVCMLVILFALFGLRFYALAYSFVGGAGVYGHTDEIGGIDEAVCGDEEVSVSDGVDGRGAGLQACDG